MNNLPNWIALLARVLLCGIFILSGTQKLMMWDQTAEHMRSEGMVAVPFMLGAAAFVEIAGGLSLLLGTWARLGALALFLFLIPTTVIFHDFWQYQGEQQQMQMMHFVKNITIMGGLLMVVAFGPGKYSVVRPVAAEHLLVRRPQMPSRA